MGSNVSHSQADKDNKDVVKKEQEALNQGEYEEKNPESDRSRTELSSDTVNKDISAGEYREKIIEALKKVIDPEIYINIVDLGLVYKVEISNDLQDIEIEFTLTTPGCPLAEEIEQSIEEAALGVLPQAKVSSSLVWTPMWNADFMSEDARLELGFPI